MWQNNLGGFAFQAGVLLQPFAWMWLHGSSLQAPKYYRYYFYLAAASAILLLGATGFSVGYYRTHILVQYVLLTAASVCLYSQRFSFKDALCLGFLTVYMNSYYWELPLHIAEYLTLKFHAGMLVQLARLIPLPYLLSRYRPTSYALVKVGLGLSGAAVALHFRVSILMGNMLYALARTFCLWCLTKTIIESEVKK